MSAYRVTILGLGFAGFLGMGLAQAAPESLQACLAECKKAKLSETNRASCRLDCETEAASDPDLIRAEIDRTTTTTTPRPTTPTPPTTPTTTTTTPTAPTTTPTPTAPAQGPGCKAACDADRSLSVDDRATCKLECDLDPDSPVNRTTPSVPSGPPPKGSSPLTFQLSGPPPSEAAQAGFIERCYATCQKGPYKLSATDFETCKLDCQTMASVVDLARGFVPDAWLEGPAAPQPTTPAQPTKVAVTPKPVGPATTPTPAKTTTPRAPASDRSVIEICGDELSSCNKKCSGAVKRCQRGCGGRIETDRETCKLTCETDSEVCQNDCLASNATCVNTRQRQP